MIFRMTNERYDRIAAAARQSARARRTSTFTAIDDDSARQFKASKSWKSMAKSVLFDPRPVASEKIGLTMAIAFMSLPDLAMIAEDRGNMRFEVTKLAFAVAEYRAQKGDYPAKLADLVPKYVAAIPQDVFSGGALHYKPQADGYLLYSVGPNGKDDGGRSQWDNPGNEKLTGCDDIAVRISAKAK